MPFGKQKRDWDHPRFAVSPLITHKEGEKAITKKRG